MRWPSVVPRTAPTSTAESSWPPRASRSTAIERSIVHWVDHMPARRQWVSRRRYSSAATAGSPRRASMEAFDVPATPLTNEAPLRSREIEGAGKALPRSVGVAGEVGLSGAVPGVGGVGADVVPHLREQGGGLLVGRCVAGVRQRQHLAAECGDAPAPGSAPAPGPGGSGARSRPADLRRAPGSPASSPPSPTRPPSSPRRRPPPARCGAPSRRGRPTSRPLARSPPTRRPRADCGRPRRRQSGDRPRPGRPAAAGGTRSARGPP